jgi:ketosteroid isomerase-like protein
MITNLPQAIEGYFRSANAHDSNSLMDCFAEDAVVHDEGKVYNGLAAIKEWNESSKTLELTLEIVSAVQEDKETIVTAMVSGKFDGSPISIDFHFMVENHKIASLRCV